jgi:DNA-binding protein
VTEEKPTEPQKTEEKSTQPSKPEKASAPVPARREPNTVFIGQKPVMNYVTACLTVLNTGGKEVTLKARGNSISRAVDTVEVLRRGFIKDLVLKDIKMGTEEMTREGNRKSNVSTIEITVTRKESE